MWCPACSSPAFLPKMFSLSNMVKHGQNMFNHVSLQVNMFSNVSWLKSCTLSAWTCFNNETWLPLWNRWSDNTLTMQHFSWQHTDNTSDNALTTKNASWQHPDNTLAILSAYCQIYGNKLTIKWQQTDNIL